MAMNNPTEPLLSGSSDHNDEDASQSSFFDGSSPRGAGDTRPRESQVSSRALFRRSLKRKGLGVPRARRLTWICMDTQGEKTFLHADKRAIIGKLGLSIPIRDMRLLDHNLLQGDSVILVREGAIIASLEHVRLIIMHDKVIIPREGVENNPLACRFVDILDEAIQEWLEQKVHFEEHMLQQHSDSPNKYHEQHQHHDEVSSMSDLEQDVEPLPFELVVLEAALKEVIGSISMQATDIERIIMPAMDALVKSVNPSNLECVRKVKTRLQRITGRCEAVRDELQRFLQDDEDMDRMCLTRKKEIEGDMLTKHQSNEDLQSENNRPSIPYNSNSRNMSMSTSFSHRRGMLMRQSMSTTSPMPLVQPTGGLSTVIQQEDDVEADIEAHLEVENLLESYFMQVDSMYDKLETLGEYIKDTEEYINIELDSSRNRLIRFDIVLSVATFALMPFNMVSGMLGENLILPEPITGSVKQFIGVNAASAMICFLAFYGIMLYMKLYKLM